MFEWSPDCYLEQAGPRLRPGLDLLARIPKPSPERVYDLGCGPGNLTERLARRWPQAAIAGIDSSAEMLEQARTRSSRVSWIEADVAEWEPEARADVLFSNACLHWVPDHERLLPRLVRFLEPGGVLAVQMPRNFSSPSHTSMAEAAAESRWRELLLPALLRDPVASPERYYDILSPLCRGLDIWETIYLHRLEGENPVVDWLRGTALRPLLDALPGEDERALLLADYSRRIEAAYPRHSDGSVLFPFRRLFFVAEIA